MKLIKLEVEICEQNEQLFDEGWATVELDCEYSVDEDDDGRRYPIEEVFTWDKTIYTELENSIIAESVEAEFERLVKDHYSSWLWQCDADRESYELERDGV